MHSQFQPCITVEVQCLFHKQFPPTADSHWDLISQDRVFVVLMVPCVFGNSRLSQLSFLWVITPNTINIASACQTFIKQTFHYQLECSQIHRTASLLVHSQLRLRNPKRFETVLPKSFSKFSINMLNSHCKSADQLVLQWSIDLLYVEWLKGADSHDFTNSFQYCTAFLVLQKPVPFPQTFFQSIVIGKGSSYTWLDAMMLDLTYIHPQ